MITLGLYLSSFVQAHDIIDNLHSFVNSIFILGNSFIKSKI